MEPNKVLFNVTKTDNDKTQIILQNILIMLSNRIFIDSTGKKQRLLDPDYPKKKIDDKGDGTYIIKANNNDNYAVKIIFQKISAVGKQSMVSEFFREYNQYKKIIIASDFNNKIVEFVTKHQTQIFRESALMIDIISHEFQPKFELLSPSEMEKVKEEYNITDYTTEKILRSDPIVKYFALRKGDIVRIIRPSPTSGLSIGYRIVA